MLKCITNWVHSTDLCSDPPSLTGVEDVKTNEDVKMQVDNYLQVQRKWLVFMKNLSIGFVDSLYT